METKQLTVEYDFDIAVTGGLENAPKKKLRIVSAIKEADLIPVDCRDKAGVVRPHLVLPLDVGEYGSDKFWSSQVVASSPISETLTTRPFVGMNASQCEFVCEDWSDTLISDMPVPWCWPAQFFTNSIGQPGCCVHWPQHFVFHPVR